MGFAAKLNNSELSGETSLNIKFFILAIFILERPNLI